MEYNDILMTLITTVVIPAIGIIGSAVYKLFQEKIKNQNVKKYILIARDCVADAVADIAQTYVDKISDNDWDDEAKHEAFEMAKEKSLQNLGITGKELLEEAFGDFDGWINTKVEAEVKRLKLK